jgi:hypothetical protein
MHQMYFEMNHMGYPAHMFQPPHHYIPIGDQIIGARPTPIEPKFKKERKDKNAPKRNWTSYQFYVEEVSVALNILL